MKLLCFATMLSLSAGNNGSLGGIHGNDMTGAVASERTSDGRSSQLIFRLFSFDYCKELDVPNTYETEEVGIITFLLRLIFGTSSIRGDCTNVCERACDHQACVPDFLVSTEEFLPTCTCISDPSTTDGCGDNAQCTEGICGCAEDFLGNPIIGCVSPEDSPPPLDEAFPFLVEVATKLGDAVSVPGGADDAFPVLSILGWNGQTSDTVLIQGLDSPLEIIRVILEESALLDNISEGDPEEDPLPDDIDELIQWSNENLFKGTVVDAVIVANDGSRFPVIAILLITEDENGFERQELFIVDESDAVYDDILSRRLQAETCGDLVEAAIEALNCDEDESIDVDEACVDGATATYNGLVAAAQGEYDAEIRRAQVVLDTGLALLKRRRLVKFGRALLRCSRLRIPWLIAGCMALETAKLVAEEIAKRAALEAAKELALENADVLLRAALAAACLTGRGLVAVCISCTSIPTPSPMRMPTPPPMEMPTPPTGPEPFFSSGVFGDPHLSTFDRLRFDCQAFGEFTMLTTLETPDFKIQERFSPVDSGACSQASVSTGIVMNDVDLPLIQVSIPRGVDDAGTTNFGACPVDFFVDGDLQSLAEASNAQGIEIVASSSRITVRHVDSGLAVQLRIRSSTWGCFFLVQVFLPSSYRADETRLGLLGIPNNNRNDDWVARDGSVLPAPTTDSDSIFGPAYEYCVTNWCERQPEDSLFTYRAGETFASISGCDATYSSEVEALVNSAPPEITNVCGSNTACLVDGVCGALADAEAALEDETAVVEASEAAENRRTVLEVAIMSPGAAFTEQMVAFVVSVTNVGAFPAENVQIQLELPTDGSLISTDPTTDPPTGGIILFMAGDITPSAKAEVTVTWQTPDFETFLALIASASSENANSDVRSELVNVGSTSVVTGGVASAGVALRNRDSGTFDITDVPAGAIITRAVLVWAILYRGNVPSNEITFDGMVVTADLGADLSTDLCWGDSATIGYSADVTSLVTGNKVYELTNVISGSVRSDAQPAGTLPYTDGASLFIFFGGTGFEKQVLSDFTYTASNGSGPNNDRTLTGIESSGGQATLYLAGPDGQNNFFESITISGPQGALSFDDTWDGSAPISGQPLNIGNLWDHDIHDISTIIGAGSDMSLNVSIGSESDCTGLSAVVLEVQ